MQENNPLLHIAAVHLLPDVLPAVVGLDQAVVAGAIVAADCEQLLSQDTHAWAHCQQGGNSNM